MNIGDIWRQKVFFLHPKNYRSTQWIPFCKLCFAILVLLYVVIRWINVDLTNDERPRRLSYADTISGKNLEDQVQVPIYLLGALCVDLLPFKEVTCLRLPSVLAFIVYLCAAFGITRMLRPRWLDLLSFIALCTNAYMLDFFSIARGFGLALAFSLASLYFLFRTLHIQNHQRSTLMEHLSLWSAWIAVVSCISFIHLYASIWLILFYLSFNCRTLFKDPKFQKPFWPYLRTLAVENRHLFANAMMLALFYGHRIILMQRAGSLYHGGKEGFIPDTVGSLIRTTLYNRPPEDITFLAAYCISFLSLGILVHLIFWKKKRVLENIGLILSLIIFFHALSTTVLHNTLGVLYLTTRAAVVLIPIFIAQVCFYTASISNVLFKRIGATILLGVIIVGAWPSNLTHTRTWRMTASNREMLRDVEKLRPSETSKSLVGLFGGMQSKIPYYIDIFNMKWLQTYTIDTQYRFTGKYIVHPNTDYVYVWERSANNPRKLLDALPIELIKRYKSSQCALYRITNHTALQAKLHPVSEKQ